MLKRAYFVQLNERSSFNLNVVIRLSRLQLLFNIASSAATKLLK